MAAGEAAFTRLGVDSMDATHGEFIALVDELNHTADAQAFADGFARLGAHTQRHFEHESRLMRACRFPAIGEHESAHARVLGELAFIQRQVSAGRLAPARDYVRGAIAAGADVATGSGNGPLNHGWAPVVQTASAPQP